MRLDDTKLFEEYTCYKIFHKKMQRWQVCLVSKVNRNKRRTILYSKYLMSLYVGRILTKEEEVDHIDDNKLNDDLSNLEIVTHEENRRRHSIMNPATMVSLVCPKCQKKFSRKKKNTFFTNKNKKRSFCTLECSGSFYGSNKYKKGEVHD